MKRTLLSALALASAIVWLASAPTARAEPSFVPIDGSHEEYKAADFGYQIQTASSDGQFHVYIELDDAAAKNFKGASLSLHRDGKPVVESNLGLLQVLSNQNHYLRCAFDREIINGGKLIIYSESIEGRPLTKNFGGFEISVDTLLERPRAAEKQEPEIIADLRVLRKTVLVSENPPLRASSPEAMRAAAMVFRRLTFAGMDRSTVLWIIGDPATVSDYGVPQDKGEDAPLVYVFDSGYGGMTYKLHFKGGKVVEIVEQDLN